MGSYTIMLLSELCEQKAYFYLLNAHNELVPFAVPALVGTKVVQVGPNKEQPSGWVGFKQNYLQRAYVRLEPVSHPNTSFVLFFT